jgi:hypothetical protein
MSLVGPWLSTTFTKKREEKITKKKQHELECGWKERNILLKELHLPKQTFEQYLEFIYGKGTKTKEKGREKTSTTLNSKVPTSSSKDEILSVAKTLEENRKSKIPSKEDTVKGPCSSKPSPVYTGSKVIGIGTMHKSNMVPIFSDDEAKDISSMRR